jgi:hypothetical protein
MCNLENSNHRATVRTIVQQVGKNFKEFAFNCGSAAKARRILREKDYTTFEIAKKGSSEKRTIEAPSPALKDMQKRALEALETLKISEKAHGFTKGKNNATAATEAAKKLGISKATIIGWDMRKAFPTINRDQVRKLWKEAIPNITKWQSHALGRICCRNGVLATGSPVSPHILNLVARKLDLEMTLWTNRNGGVFVRYADDCVLIVYTHRKDKIKAAQKALKRAIEKSGFIAHPEKHYCTRLEIDSPAAEIVGAMVKPSQVKTRKKFRRKMRALIHQAKRRCERDLRASETNSYKHLWQRIQGLTSYSVYLSSMPTKTCTMKTATAQRC